MIKKVSPVFAVVTIVVMLMGVLLVSPAAAQEGSTDPNTPVSNIDGALPVVESNSNIVAPFAGSGKLRATSADAEALSAAAVGGPTSESVIGADGRVKVNATTTYPSRAIAYLYVVWKDNSAGSCTGWFVGPRTVVTAGHCVWNTAAGTGHGWAKSITVYPGRNGASIPYGSTTAHRFFSVTGWTTSASTNYDYGAIQTNAALGNTVGYFGFHWQSSNSFPGNFTLRGYPGDKPTATMWTMNGPVTAANTYRLWYSIDTYGGQSGSPFYQTISGVCCYGFGVHTYAASVSPNFGNSATRITHAVFNNFVSWKAVAYP